MRMRLYAAKVVRSDGAVHSNIVAPASEVAAEFVEQYHRELGLELKSLSLTRIDETLPVEHRMGLDDMLVSAPIGFATRSTQFGWFVHSVLQPRHKLYTIEPEGGEDAYVIAANADAASALWLWSLQLEPKDARPRFKVFSGLDHLDDRQIAGLKELLDNSPAGVITWHERRGWSLS